MQVGMDFDSACGEQNLNVCLLNSTFEGKCFSFTTLLLSKCTWEFGDYFLQLWRRCSYECGQYGDAVCSES